MIGVTLLIVAGWAVGYAVYDSYQDDDDDNTSVGTEEDVEDNTRIYGTSGDDTLTGDDDTNSIWGFLGKDHLTGNGGDDRLDGGDNDDNLLGNDGNDLILGGTGDDIALGGDGDDTLRGATGDDILQGDKGNDNLSGDLGGDWLDGGDGDDVLNGGPGDDALIGGTGEDTLTGGTGDDILIGGELLDRALTEDELNALRLANQTSGIIDLPDDNSFNIVDDGAADRLDGGDGDDTLFVGDGDTALGGNGADEFLLLDGEGTDTASLLDFDTAEDTLIYVYEAGTTEPALALTDNGDGTQTLTADGVAVAVVSSAVLSTDDIVIYERGTTSGALI